MAKIPDEFVPLYVRYRRDRAIRRVGNDGELMYLRSLAHSKAEKTDGLIEDFDLDDIGSGIADKHDVARRLVEENLWIKVPGGWVIRSFEKWNPYTDRSNDGKRGNHDRWHTKRGEVNPDCEFCIADASPRIAPDIAPDSAGESALIADLDIELDIELEKKETSSSELRPDIAELLDHLDRCVQANGAKRPSRNKANTDAARLILDKDKRDPGEAHRLIDWASKDTFWKSNILSMSKFREKYDTLRMQSTRGSTGRKQIETDELFARAMQRAHEADAAREAGQVTVDAFGLPIQPAIEGRVL